MPGDISHISFDRIRERVQLAIDALMVNDYDLLQIDTNERSTSHCFATYLQHEFPGWNVDCEYNRKLGDKKTLRHLAQNFEGETLCPDDTIAKTVYPDIIVHSRQQERNLLVIEIKKSGYKLSSDERKLEAFTGHQYNYQFGLLLILKGASEPELRWYRHGITLDPEAMSV